MSETVPTRRERLRAQTESEIRERAYAQIADGGTASLSLNGIARAMGMSGPAMYRYVASRADLLVTLITESYEELAAEMEHAVAAATGPEPRLRAALGAYRDWALRSPHRYRLVFESSYSSGALAPDRIIPAATRVMDLLLDGFSALPGFSAPRVADAPLRAELRAWGARTSHRRGPLGLLWLGQIAWTRLHGILSLEIEGVHAQMGVDAGRLYAGEVSGLIRTARGS